jgi:aspartyl-tRNA(Asn)/glutamyl-tRNA(Gln) amidotransferase subunit B
MSLAGEPFETVIGLECHVQLQTASKLFSPAQNHYGDPPNTNVDVVDAGLPGVLPVVNRRAVEFAVRLGLALNCSIRQHNVFARKHYFYPDLPKGYQISQYELPICEGGYIDIETDAGSRRIGITRIHMEEDAGKNIHVDGKPESLCDYNRAGTPLLEVVSEPDLRHADEAMAYMRALRQIVTYLEICDGNMQEGSMRADANVSVMPVGSTSFGERTEMKNLNSIRYLGQAIHYESARQIMEVKAGRPIALETRLWDPDKKESRSMRGKEEAHDYRYFPDPDLLPVQISDAEIASTKQNLPELPQAKIARFQSAFALSQSDAEILAAARTTADYFEAAIAAHDNPKSIANWIINDVFRAAKEKLSVDNAAIDADMEQLVLQDCGISPEAIAGLVALIDDGTISGKIAKKVFAEMESGKGTDPAQIVQDNGWRVQRDSGQLQQIIDEALEANPKQVAQFLGGKEKILGFFVGQVMKETKGQGDPGEVNRLLRESLNGLKNIGADAGDKTD